MHQPSGAMQGQAADIAIQAEQIIYLKRMMAERIAFHTGQPVERIEADSDRDRWFTAEEAREYGFIDQVIDRSAARRGSAERGARGAGVALGRRTADSGRRREAFEDVDDTSPRPAELPGSDARDRRPRSPGWFGGPSAWASGWPRSGAPGSS